MEDNVGGHQLFTVCGRRTYRFDVQTEQVTLQADGAVSCPTVDASALQLMTSLQEHMSPSWTVMDMLPMCYARVTVTPPAGRT